MYEKAPAFSAHHFAYSVLDNAGKHSGTGTCAPAATLGYEVERGVAQ